jgi:hypothetical protein
MTEISAAVPPGAWEKTVRADSEKRRKGAQGSQGSKQDKVKVMTRVRFVRHGKETCASQQLF